MLYLSHSIYSVFNLALKKTEIMPSSPLLFNLTFSSYPKFCLYAKTYKQKKTPQICVSTFSQIYNSAFPLYNSVFPPSFVPLLIFWK